jgi:hypothetical protein
MTDHRAIVSRFEQIRGSFPPESGYDSPVSATGAGRVLDALVSALERLVPLAAALRRATARLGLAALAAAAAIAWALFRHGRPDSTGKQIGAYVLVAALLAPPAVLGSFWLALRELVELPDRLRSLPGTSRENAAELGRLARDAHASRGRSAFRVGALWRLLRLTQSSRELLTPYAPVVALASVPFLLAVTAAALAAVAEVAAAVLVVLVGLVL